jgi:hypothetical protein
MNRKHILSTALKVILASVMVLNSGCTLSLNGQQNAPGNLLGQGTNAGALQGTGDGTGDAAAAAQKGFDAVIKDVLPGALANVQGATSSWVNTPNGGANWTDVVRTADGTVVSSGSAGASPSSTPTANGPVSAPGSAVFRAGAVAGFAVVTL